MQFIRPVLSILMFASLVACGSNDDDGGQSALQTISGVWDSSMDEDGMQDIHYTVIRPDGTSSDYDYLADSFDNTEDCYAKYDFNLTHEGDSRFIVTSEDIGGDQVFDLSVENGVLQVVILNDDDDGGIHSFPSAALSEAEFTPLCDANLL